jgi:hypothetical protein
MSVPMHAIIAIRSQPQEFEGPVEYHSKHLRVGAGSLTNMGIMAMALQTREIYLNTTWIAQLDKLCDTMVATNL